MKILFVVGDYYERRRKYGEVMRELGHDVSIVSIDKKKKKRISAKYFNGIDLIWALKYDYVEHGIIPPQENIPLIAMHTCGKGRTLKNTVKILKPYDIVFENNEDFADRLNEIEGREKFYYIPLGFYPEQYYPLDRKPKIDASFMGSKMNSRPLKLDLRVQNLKLVMKHCKVKVYGRGLCRALKLKDRKFSTHKKQREVYARTKVNLNFPWCNSMLPDFEGVVHANNRFFEITACKRLALTAYSPSLNKLLEEGKETFYYHDKGDLIEKTKYILENYDALESVREAGYQRCIKEHTFKHRIEKVLKMVKDKL